MKRPKNFVWLVIVNHLDNHPIRQLSIDKSLSLGSGSLQTDSRPSFSRTLAAILRSHF
jgi:hypothetical protein